MTGSVGLGLGIVGLRCGFPSELRCSNDWNRLKMGIMSKTRGSAQNMKFLFKMIIINLMSEMSF